MTCAYFGFFGYHGTIKNAQTVVSFAKLTLKKYPLVHKLVILNFGFYSVKDINWFFCSCVGVCRYDFLFSMNVSKLLLYFLSFFLIMKSQSSYAISADFGDAAASHSGI